MELVYLWVEEYKNIQKQGFNFSPRFTCDYDDVKKELTIDENDDYIENFFGENINVTAIVGKNGSGKSSVLRFLRLFVNQHEYINNRGLVVFYNKENKTFVYQSSFNIDVLNFPFKIRKIEYLKHTSFPMFDYSFTEYKVNYDIEKKQIFPKKYSEEYNGILFNRENIRNVGNIIKNYKYLKRYNQLGKFDDFFIPEKILVNIDFQALKQRYGIKDKYGLEFLKEKLDELEQILIKDITIEDFGKLFFDINKEFEFFFNLHILPIFNMGKHKNQYIKKTNKKGVYTIFEFDIDSLNYVQGEAYDKKYIDMDGDFLLHQERYDEWEKYRKENIFVKSTGRELLEYVEDTSFVFDVRDRSNKSLNHLSFGEQQLVDILNQIFTLSISDNIIEDSGEWVIDTGQITINEGIYDLNLQNFIVFLDEIDIGFHPDWQKRTIQYIIDFLSLIPEKQFHLIFTTHSPFLLSDIPKQNIIFLDKDEKTGKCIVVKDGLREKKETFGANIHTLLSDSFFMEDGLMGEFAKGKIDEVISYLNGKKDTNIKSDDEAQKLINIIGEPIVKNQLQRMLDSKRLKKVDEIDAIKKSMIEMQKRLDELEDDKNK